MQSITESQANVMRAIANGGILTWTPELKWAISGARVEWPRSFSYGQGIYTATAKKLIKMGWVELETTTGETKIYKLTNKGEFVISFFNLKEN